MTEPRKIGFMSLLDFLRVYIDGPEERDRLRNAATLAVAFSSLLAEMAVGGHAQFGEARRLVSAAYATLDAVALLEETECARSAAAKP